MLVIFYHMIKSEVSYVELGGDSLHREAEPLTRYYIKRLERLRPLEENFRRFCIHPTEWRQTGETNIRDNHVDLSSLDGGAPSIHGEFCAVNETGTVCRQKGNRVRNFVGRSRTARGRLGS